MKKEKRKKEYNMSIMKRSINSIDHLISNCWRKKKYQLIIISIMIIRKSLF